MKKHLVALACAAALSAVGAPTTAKACAVTSLQMMNDLRILFRDAPGTMAGLGACMLAGSGEYDTKIRQGFSRSSAKSSADATFGLCAVGVCLLAGGGCFTVAERGFYLMMRAEELKRQGC